MKPEEKDLKARELNEDELSAAAGGQQGTLQYEKGMFVGPSTMEYQPGVNNMQPETLELYQTTNPAQPGFDPHRLAKNNNSNGGVHSV